MGTGALTFNPSAVGADGNLYEVTIDAVYHIKAGGKSVYKEVATQTIYVGKADPKTSPFLSGHLGNSIYVYI